MTDQFTSTEGSNQYVVRFEPKGERIIVNAGNAVAALALGRQVAEMLDFDHNGGIDTFPVLSAGDLEHKDNVYPAPIPTDKVEEMKLAQREERVEYPDPVVTYVEPTNQLGDEIPELVDLFKGHTPGEEE